MRMFALLLIPAALIAPAAVLAQSAPPAPAPPQPGKAIDLYEAFGLRAPGLRGAELEAAVAAAAPHPLGSEKNPVRTRGIAGQRAYFARLRCPDRKPPRVLGRFTGPLSPFGGVSDVYGLACAGQPDQQLAMDMYHDHVEAAAIPGFTIVAP